MSKIIDTLRAKIESLGGKLDDTDYTLNLDAPSGYVWRANGEPNLAIHYATNRESRLAKAVTAEQSSLAMGLEKVTDAEQLADIRWSLDDDNWGAPAGAPDRLEWPS